MAETVVVEAVIVVLLVAVVVGGIVTTRFGIFWAVAELWKWLSRSRR
jgi:hypothetical protein